MRRDSTIGWYVYVLLAYGIIATAGWVRSEADDSRSSLQPSAAAESCECDPRVDVPTRAITQIAYAPQAACASGVEAVTGAAGAAAPPSQAVPADAIAAEIGRSLVDELYGSAESELDQPAELIAALEDLQSDHGQLPDDRLEAAFVLRRLRSAPPTAAVTSDLLELAAAKSDSQLALDVLEVTAGALEPNHAEALIDLAQSDSPDVRNATMLRLYELLRDPAARGGLLPAIAGRSEPLDALAHYVRSED